MKPTLLIALILALIGLYPGYAHHIIDTAREIVCSMFPGEDRSILMMIIIIIAIVGVSCWKPTK